VTTDLNAAASDSVALIGTFGLFGGVGIMVALGVGGILFDAWRPAGPSGVIRMVPPATSR